MNLQKITNISVVLLAVLALIVLGVIIGQGDEYIEMSAMQGNFGAVSVMINLALFVLLVTVLMTLVFSMKNLFSEKSKLKKAGISIGSFLFVFIVFSCDTSIEKPNILIKFVITTIFAVIVTIIFWMLSFFNVFTLKNLFL